MDLTTPEDTGAQKGGFLRDAAQHGIALVFPDTSPRGAGVEGEDADWVSLCWASWSSWSDLYRTLAPVRPAQPSLF